MKLRVIGLDVPAEVITERLRSGSCFGDLYAKSAEECKACTAPVIVDGTLLLMKEACRAATAETAPGELLRLTSQQVLRRWEEGRSVPDIFREILNGADPEAYGTDAREILYRRFRYLTKKDPEDAVTAVPDIPPTKELIKHV